MRLALLVVLLAVSVRADSASDAIDVCATMAGALSDDNAAGFVKALAPEMAGRDQLAANVRAMMTLSETTSGIDILRNEGDDQKRIVVLDWSLQMKRKGDTVQSERRQAVVTVTVIKTGKKWRVSAIEPLNFFEPPRFQ